MPRRTVTVGVRGRPRRAALVGTLAGLLALAGWAVVDASSPARHPPAQPQQHPASGPAAPTPTDNGIASGPARAGEGPAGPTEAEISRLRAVPPVKAAATRGTITGEAAHQPDLYAAEFVHRLLTQDYRRPRAGHLAWVQSEAATTAEPLVIGLVPPELRDRLAVHSLTDASEGPAPIPSQQEWRALGLAHGYTTVQVERVSEPLAWANAVASGRITDPGITGREVAAMLTRHTVSAHGPRTTRFSVALTLNLQGPPTRDTWGFVTAATYRAIPLSAP
jgi:hypothetical protein